MKKSRYEPTIQFCNGVEMTQREYDRLVRTLNEVAWELNYQGFDCMHMPHSNFVVVFHADMIEVASHIPYHVGELVFDQFGEYVAVLPKILHV